MISTVVRIGLICLGLALIVLSIRLNSVKKILINHAVIWSIVGLALILTGALPVLSSWTALLAPGTVVVFFAVALLLLITELRNSIALSQLTLKNRELAMHVALLNQEYEQLLGATGKLDSAATPREVR